MGCHTWFWKSAKIVKRIEELDELAEYGNEFAEKESDDLHESNHTNYSDIFRLGGYPEDQLFSLEETLKYLEDNDDKIYYTHTIFDKTPKDILKRYAIKKLKEFWEEYPEGLIDFG